MAIHMPQLQIVSNRKRNEKPTRHPKHNFLITQRPFQLQPFLLAPVLAGESLKAAFFQARTVSDPVNNKLIGWHNEVYLYYVKLRDLEDRDLLTAMMLDPDLDTSSLDAITSFPNNIVATGDTTIDWVQRCLERVTETHFRSEGDDWDAELIDGMPAIRVNSDSWLDSVGKQSDLITADDIEFTSASEGDADIKVHASEISHFMDKYELSKAMNLTDMTFDDYLEMQGVNVNRKDSLNKPLLLRYWRDWTYPTNTVDPTDGSPTSALSWSMAEKLTRSTFFKEPGFLFGVIAQRPKTYFRKVASNAASVMVSAQHWLPRIMSSDPYSSLHLSDTLEGPLNAATFDYAFDIKDLLLYGDQYVNFEKTSGDNDHNLVDLPANGLGNIYYPDLDDCNKFFVDTTDASGLTKCRTDGRIDLHISTHEDMVDTTPMTIGTSEGSTQ